MRTATQLKPREEALLTGFSNDRMAAMMLELGCLPGSRVRLVRRGLWHGPLYLEIADRILAFRENEADALLVSDFAAVPI